jgi:hypothetical protein
MVLFDFTKGSAAGSSAASLINCRKNQRNAQVLDFASDFWVSVGALAERLTLLREIEAGKAAIVGCPTGPTASQPRATVMTPKRSATLKKSNERSMNAPISLFIRRCK